MTRKSDNETSPGRGNGADEGSGLRDLSAALDKARVLLEKNADEITAIRPAIRALRRLSRRVRRPIRIAILGESNSGKSTLANAILQLDTLPASVVSHTRLPTLLIYGPSPSVVVRYSGGGSFPLRPGTAFAEHNLLRIEVGLPLDVLQDLELIDFPGSSDPLFPLDVADAVKNEADAAIWTTVATQAWRDTERAVWSELPLRIRLRGLLVVSQCDLISAGADREKLRNRLETVASAHFNQIVFFGRANGASNKERVELKNLLDAIVRLKRDFGKERAEKAAALTQRIAARALSRIPD